MFGWQFIIKYVPGMNKYMNSYWLGMMILVYAYRADFIFYFGLVSIWYYLTKIYRKSKYVLYGAWITVLLILFLNEQFDHFRPLSIWF